jgi:hypothetical protein
MTIVQTIEVPADRRITLEVPPEIPAGKTIIAFTPAAGRGRDPGTATRNRRDPKTVEEALRMAEEKAADPNRKPISRLFGKHKGIFGGDGVAYQRAIRDEWD